jgi:glycosyltransferase involved in cell wall biosynthesis
MNIAWHSAPAYFPTGYGVQTNGFVRRLMGLGHSVVVITTTASVGLIWEGIVHVPGGPEHPALNGMVEWPKRLPIDAMITLIDAWVIPIEYLEELKMMGIKWCPYSPVDHDPIPPDIEKVLRYGDYTLAMSPYTLREFERVGLPNPRYLPHGVETRIFFPRPQHKEMFQARNMFVAGMVSTNVEPIGRKGFRYAFDAWEKFHKKHDDVRLYIHCDSTRSSGGLDLVQMAQQRGFMPYSPDMWMLQSNIAPEKMAEIYSTFDVLLMPSGGEGFGIPLIEAQACGTPVIATDFTAPADLVGAGWLIPSIGTQSTPMNSYWGIPDTDKIVDALEEAYDLWKAEKLRKEMRDKAVEFARDFDFDIITEKYLIPLIEEIDYGETTAPKTETSESDERGGQEAINDISE